ncbi:methyltransferase domain-containing protein [Parasphingorhabdus sp.]|uniref:methyltransferase domain-containing protein n=1 Tax=Parasphingorhabdus sp. TaxID=2709688 RepID=UPI003002BA34
MTDTVNVPDIFDRRRRRLVRDRACVRAGGNDFFSRLMVEEILERLDVVKRQFRRALLIGLPARQVAEQLKARGIRVICADSGTLAADALGGVQCDDDRLPFADHSFDLIINIGSLDTVNDLPGALVLMRRILAPDGLMLAALVGAESFPALKSLMMRAEEDRVAAHIHPQIDVRTAGDLVVRAGLALPVADSDSLRLNYSSLERLLADIRDTGGTNIISGRGAPVRRDVYERMRDLFQARSGPDGKFAETVTILYLCAWAAHPDQPKPARRGSGQTSLADTLSDSRKGPRDN